MVAHRHAGVCYVPIAGLVDQFGIVVVSQDRGVTLMGPSRPMSWPVGETGWREGGPSWWPAAVGDKMEYSVKEGAAIRLLGDKRWTRAAA